MESMVRVPSICVRAAGQWAVSQPRESYRQFSTGVVVLAGLVGRLSFLPTTGPSGSLSAMPRRVVIVVYPGLQALDVVGPHEVFHQAARLVRGAYEIELVGDIATTTSGLTL